MTYICICLGIY